MVISSTVSLTGINWDEKVGGGPNPSTIPFYSLASRKVGRLKPSSLIEVYAYAQYDIFRNCWESTECDIAWVFFFMLLTNDRTMVYVMSLTGTTCCFMCFNSNMEVVVVFFMFVWMHMKYRTKCFLWRKCWFTLLTAARQRPTSSDVPDRPATWPS